MTLTITINVKIGTNSPSCNSILRLAIVSQKSRPNTFSLSLSWIWKMCCNRTWWVFAKGRKSSMEIYPSTNLLCTSSNILFYGKSQRGGKIMYWMQIQGYLWNKLAAITSIDNLHFINMVVCVMTINVQLVEHEFQFCDWQQSIAVEVIEIKTKDTYSTWVHNQKYGYIND